MLIGELANQSRLSRDTIRWYEKIGLLDEDDSSRGLNNYRVYGEDALSKLILIRESKAFGFSLGEIKEMLELMEADNLHCDTVVPLITTKLKAIDEKISYLDNIRSKLISLQEKCTGECKDQILGSS